MDLQEEMISKNVFFKKSPPPPSTGNTKCHNLQRLKISNTVSTVNIYQTNGRFVIYVFFKEKTDFSSVCLTFSDVDIHLALGLDVRCRAVV